MENSSDEETEPVSHKIDLSAHVSLKDSSNSVTTDVKVFNTSNDFDQSDSFIRDAMLEQQNLNDKKLVKRGKII